jgi:hypothetical protein
MHKPIITADLSAYHDAMALSLHDDEWFSAALKNKENLYEITKHITKENTEVAVNKFLSSKNIGEILKYKKVSMIDETAMNILLDTKSIDSKKSIIDAISKKTEHNCAVTVSLLSEYCDKTRDLFDAQVTPFPENIEDTFAPIKKFKINVGEKHLIVALETNRLVTDNTEHVNSINEYFLDRAKSKNICRGYFCLENEQEVANLRNRLLYFKEVKLPMAFANTKEGDYKVIYRENQICHLGTYDFTIDGGYLKVLHIEKSGDS